MNITSLNFNRSDHMRCVFIFLAGFISLNLVGQTDMEIKKDFFDGLNPEEKRVIVDKGTERPFSGKYCDHYEAGIYVCKACSTPLYKSTDKLRHQTKLELKDTKSSSNQQCLSMKFMPD